MGFGQAIVDQRYPDQRRGRTRRDGNRAGGGPIISPGGGAVVGRGIGHLHRGIGIGAVERHGDGELTNPFIHAARILGKAHARHGDRDGARGGVIFCVCIAGGTYERRIGQAEISRQRGADNGSDSQRAQLAPRQGVK